MVVVVGWGCLCSASRSFGSFLVRFKAMPGLERFEVSDFFVAISPQFAVRPVMPGRGFGGAILNWVLEILYQIEYLETLQLAF